MVGGLRGGGWGGVCWVGGWGGVGGGVGGCGGEVRWGMGCGVWCWSLRHKSSVDLKGILKRFQGKLKVKKK